MKNILIIGGSGYLGSNIVSKLILNKKYNITLLSSTEVESNFGSNVNIVKGKLKDFDKINVVVKKDRIDTILHLASSILPNSSYEDLLKEEIDIIVPTQNIIRLCSKKEIKLVFFSSGGAVYGETKIKEIKETHPLNPISYYGFAKKKIEDFIQFEARNNNLKFLILRPSNPYGGYINYNNNHGLILAIINCIKNKKTLNIYVDKNTTRDFIHIDELVDSVTRLLKSKNKNGCFNIATGFGTSISDICDFFLKKFPNRFRVNYHENLIKDVSSSVLCVNKLNKNYPKRVKISFTEGLNIISETLIDTP